MTTAAPRRVFLLTRDDFGFCDLAKDVLRRAAAESALDVGERGLPARPAAVRRRR